MGAAAALLVLGFCAIGLETGSAGLHEDRARAAAPVMASTPSKGRLLYQSIVNASVLGAKPVTVTLIAPLRPGAPVPPGVSAWPKPGEAVVSPAVARDLARSGAPDLFGTVAGIIAEDGLEVPEDRRVYIRPKDTKDFAERAGTIRVSGFGTKDRDTVFMAATEEFLEAEPPGDVVKVLLVGIIIPAIAALVVGAGVDGERRRRRSRILAMLGASRRQCAVVGVAEASRPVAFGALTAWLFIAVACCVTVRVPWLDASFPASETRRCIPGFVVATIAALLVCALVAVVVGQDRMGAMRRGRWVAVNGRRVAGAVMCLLAAALTIVVPASVGSSEIRQAGYLGGLMLVAVTLPCVIALTLVGIGKRLGEAGSAAGSPGVLVAGRCLQRSPERTARLSFAVCLMILLLGQVQLFAGMMSGPYRDAVHTDSALAGRLVQAGANADDPGLRAVLSSLPAGSAGVWVTMKADAANGRGAAITVYSSCGGLGALGVGCVSGRPTDDLMQPNVLRDSILGVSGGSEIDMVHVSDRAMNEADLKMSSDMTAYLFVVAADDHPLEVDRLNWLGFRNVAGGADFSSPVAGWLEGGYRERVAAGWTAVFAVIGLMILLLAVTCMLAGDALSSARRLAPAASLASRFGWLKTVALARTGLPVALAGLIGAGAYLLLPWGVNGSDPVIPPSGLFAGCCFGGAAVVGALVSLWTARKIRQRAVSWLPASG
jgi:hypothetical protein